MRYHPRYCKTCPSCAVSRETEFHFYRCPHEPRAQWRNQLIQLVQNTAATLNIHKTLVQIMIDGIQAFFAGDIVNHGNPFLIPENYPNKFQELVRQQNRIGWLNFIRGRWSKQWQLLQGEQTKKQRHSDADTIRGNWAAKIIQAIWDSVFEAWQQRNVDAHGDD